MSKSRRQILAKLIEQQKQQRAVIIPFATWCLDPEALAALPEGRPTMIPLVSWGGAPVWCLRIGDRVSACSPFSGPADEAEIEKFLRSSGVFTELRRPKIPADVQKRLEEIDALLATAKDNGAKATPPESKLPVLTHWTRCTNCGEYVERGSESATCSRCRASV